MMRTLLLLTTLLFASAWTTQAQSLLGRETLKGLRGFSVIIEEIKSNELHSGLSQDEIRTDVELRLRKAGIRVLTKEERHRTPGMPFIGVTVTMYVFEQVRSFDVKVEVWQEVDLVQNGARHAAITYRTSGLLGITSISDFRLIRDAVGDQIDVFLNDYLTVNPKK
jgi:hypothetical protein